jgi:uncharacterized protein (TIGR02598 family)
MIAARRCGFSLVEVTLALGVTAISLLAIFALLPVGLKTNQTAIEQTASTDLLSIVGADLRSTPTTTPRGASAISPLFGINIPANPVSSGTDETLFFTAEGEFSTTATATSRYRMTITFLPNGSGAHTATFVTLKVTWPAAATVANANGNANMFVALDRN